jgi:hypothetical protein
MKGIDMTTKIITSPADIIPPLEDKVADLLSGIIGGARESFETDHGCCAFFFMAKWPDVNPAIVQFKNDREKDAVFKWMHDQIPNHDACIFVTETWMAKAMKHEDPHNLLLAPSERFDRMESVMVHLWTPIRRISLCAEIARKPDTLGPWELIDDTANTDPKAPHAEGRMLGTVPGGK